MRWPTSNLYRVEVVALNQIPQRKALAEISTKMAISIRRPTHREPDPRGARLHASLRSPPKA
jgi:hypothetical protein